MESVRVALGPLDRRKIQRGFEELSEGVGETIRALYRSKDSRDRDCDVLYYFWVMQAACPYCRQVKTCSPPMSSPGTLARTRNPNVQILCPSCGHIFPGLLGQESARLPVLRVGVSIRNRGDVTGQDGRLAPACDREFINPGRHRRKTSAVPSVREACPEKRRRKGVSAGLAGRPRCLCRLFSEASRGSREAEDLAIPEPRSAGRPQHTGRR